MNPAQADAYAWVLAALARVDNIPADFSADEHAKVIEEASEALYHYNRLAPRCTRWTFSNRVVVDPPF